MNSRKPSAWAGSWYFVITVISAGLLAWVPFMHAAARLHRRSITVLTAVYAAGAVTAVVLVSLPTVDAQGEPTGGEVFAVLGTLLLLALVAGSCVQQVWLRRQVYRATSTTDPAIVAALQARARRAAARELVADDPLIARELRIGRPDLPHDYDDGGLVDLNSAPATAIAAACELTPRAADGIVAARTEHGGFLTVDDLFSMADIPIGAWDMVRDRGIVIPPST
jgi:DNA uptake protein ComE-like DNA-binding protein